MSNKTKKMRKRPYKLFEDVPKELQNTVPSLEDIESRIMDKYKCEWIVQVALHNQKYPSVHMNVKKAVRYDNVNEYS